MKWAQFGDLVISLNHVTRFKLLQNPLAVELRFQDGTIEIIAEDDARRLWNFLELCCGTREAPRGDSLGNFVSEPLSRRSS